MRKPEAPERGDHRLAGVIAAVVFLLALAVGIVTFAVVDRRGDAGSTTAAAPQWPALAPALSGDDLTAEPTNAWLTNGGTLFNQRYSPLGQIDTSNVQDLKGIWMTDLGSGLAAKYSAEGQPIVYNGVIYVPTGDDDVFAVDVETGKIRWKYESNIDQEIATICCGWLSRGVALGEGKVYVGQLDGALVALDQQTGKVAWKTEVGSWRNGMTITAAPLYYDGMIVTGVSGGEFSIRGRVQAYDAQTGKLVWQFHTIPGPGEVGHDSWPAGSDTWTHGGAPMWQTPAVDPELGLMYFSTGNGSPDLDGSRRAGDNLFAASIVAVEAKTGKLRWHFQQVHHDIWDYDAPSPVVLFDTEIDGRPRKAIAETGKTGWTYVLDRETGEPLLPVKEEPGPAGRGAAEAGRGEHTADVGDLAALSRRRLLAASCVARDRPHGADVEHPGLRVVAHRLPVRAALWAWAVHADLRAERREDPSLDDPRHRSLRCRLRQLGDLGNVRIRHVMRDEGVVLRNWLGRRRLLHSQTGYFGAWNPATGEIGWRKRWPESCYSGTVTTAGGLVFVGRNSGELEAYNADDGELLWSFQTGAGANSTVTLFEQAGKQYIAFLAGGNALAATPHGDNLWLFSLDGKLGPAKAGGAGEGTGHAGEPTTPGDPAAGEPVFANNCSGCHGLDGHGGNGGPSLAGVTDVEHVVAQVTNGGGGMPAFGDTVSAQQIQDVAAYVTQRVATGR